MSVLRRRFDLTRSGATGVSARPHPKAGHDWIPLHRPPLARPSPRRPCAAFPAGLPRGVATSTLSARSSHAPSHPPHGAASNADSRSCPRLRRPGRRVGVPGPPLGDPRIPDPARSPGARTPSGARCSRMTTVDVAADHSQLGAGPEANRRRTTHAPSCRLQLPRTEVPCGRANRRTRSAGGDCQPTSGNARDVEYKESDARSIRPHWYPQTTGTDPGRLSWGSAPYDAFRNRQRPTPGLPHPAVLRLQVFSTS
jgi:hypothetical protein